MSIVEFDLFRVLEILIPGEVMCLIVLVDGFERESIGEKARLTVVIISLDIREVFAYNGNLSGPGIGHVEQGE